MKKLLLVLPALLWLICLGILIVALTDLLPNNPFREYRLLVGIAFIVITRLIRETYKKLLKA